jgi:AcrR family transcriptional regulator
MAYSKIQWLNFALRQLVELGPESLKIASLCQALNVTKGSFYHHFNNRQDFMEALMEYWYKKMTLEFINQANTVDAPLERLEKLDHVIADNNMEAEIHIRAWALNESFIIKHLEKVDAQRQLFLKQCYIELGMSNELATDIAMINYAKFLGLLQLHPKPNITTMLRVSEIASRIFRKDLTYVENTDLI